TLPRLGRLDGSCDAPDPPTDDTSAEGSCRWMMHIDRAHDDRMHPTTFLKHSTTCALLSSSSSFQITTLLADPCSLIPATDKRARAVKDADADSQAWSIPRVRGRDERMRTVTVGRRPGVHERLLRVAGWRRQRDRDHQRRAVD